jgi:thiosulfate/3-mercaptopyruvate sulfurtransferase
VVNEISTRQLAQAIESESCSVFDARPVDAYNGWALQEERRGGHIRGARSLPVTWTGQEEWEERVRDKGALPGRPVVVYGYDHGETAEVADRFVRAGYGDVGLYHGFVEEWAEDDSLPMERMERFETLVPPGWLERLLASERPPGFDNERYVLCHCHYRNPEDYEIGHIPGAIALDTRELESPDTWNRRSPEELSRALTRLGISADTTVVVYGRFSSPNNSDPHPGSAAGHLGSIRCAVLMMYAGVKDVRVLNGTLASWGNEGYSLSTEETRPEPVPEFGTRVPARPEIMVDAPRAREILASEDENLVSVRSWEEFIGKVSGYHYVFKKGRIPGAVFGNCGSDAYHMENYRNPDLTTREYGEVEAMWRESGITPEKFNAFYCGTGWRASEAFLNAYLLGWNRIAVYDGGWYEWSNDPNNPVAVGEP